MTRLETVCSLIHNVDIFADIGCDHGLVTEYVLKNNLCKLAIASDISLLSLDKAKVKLEKFSNVNYLCCNGFIGFNDDINLAVISGMGGHNIIDILKNAHVNLDSVILQPQNNVELVRRYLVERGNITHDIISCENNKFYDILKVDFTTKSIIADKYMFKYGIYCKEKNDLLRLKINSDLNKFSKYKKTLKNIELIDTAMEVLKWQQ